VVRPTSFTIVMMVALLATVAMIQSAQTCKLVRVPIQLNAVEGLGANATSKPINPGFQWDEVIPSWNVAHSENAKLTVLIQAIGDGRESAWYQIAEWHGDMAKGDRSSMPSQSDTDADVLTDVLRVRAAFKSVRVQLHLEQVAPGPSPKLKLFTLCFSRRGETNSDSGSRREIPTIDAPQLAQGPYEFGKLAYPKERVSPEFEIWFKSAQGAQYCSPTSVAMVMRYWSAKLKRPEFNVDVPDVVAGVFDSKYPGTGNWPFNTAYVGSFPGMRSYVARLRDMRDLEEFVAAGVPVIASVSHNLVLDNGKSPGGDGHLVVVVGIEKGGDVLANDPGKSDEIRRKYRRSSFIKGWDQSGRTVYLCHPDGLRLPSSLKEIAVVD
jgi:hypothetical protein